MRTADFGFADFSDVRVPSVPVHGGGIFPVRRIFCIGKNYADHVREMGGDAGTTPPVFFTKPADAVICPSAAAPHVHYPSRTANLHFEAELVLALGAGGRDVPEAGAEALVFGLALGCDLTRRDLQAEAKKAGNPWDTAKAFDESAVIGPIMAGVRPRPGLGFRLSVNDTQRQAATVDGMIFSPARIIAELSTFFALRAGDLIYTGTPEGVGPLVRGDRVRIESDELPPLSFAVA